MPGAYGCQALFHVFEQIYVTLSLGALSWSTVFTNHTNTGLTHGGFQEFAVKNALLLALLQRECC